jgi:hypothetical protein
MITHHDGHKKKAHTLQPCFQHVVTEDYTIYIINMRLCRMAHIDKACYYIDIPTRWLLDHQSSQAQRYHWPFMGRISRCYCR